MRLTAHSSAVIFVVLAVVLWLSAAPLRGWPVVVVVLAALVLGFRASVAQRRTERRWMKSWLMKWRNQWL